MGFRRHWLHREHDHAAAGRGDQDELMACARHLFEPQWVDHQTPLPEQIDHRVILILPPSGVGIAFPLEST